MLMTNTAREAAALDIIEKMAAINPVLRDHLQPIYTGVVLVRRDDATQWAKDNGKTSGFLEEYLKGLKSTAALINDTTAHLA